MKSGSPETRPSIAFDFEADNVTGRIVSARAPQVLISFETWVEMGRAVGAGGQGAGTGTVEAR
jgi:hypothetical protein